MNILNRKDKDERTESDYREGEETSQPPNGLPRLLQAITKNYLNLIRNITEILSYIIGRKEVEESLNLKQARQALCKNRTEYNRIFLLQKLPASINEKCKEVLQTLEGSRLKSDKTVLGDIRAFVQVISHLLGKYASDDFKENSQIWKTLKELQQINLGDILTSDGNIVEWFKLSSVDALMESEFNQNAILRKIIDHFWDKYSKAFILKQRIDKYELQMEIPSESKEFLQKLSLDLELICRLVQELFEFMGIIPMYIELFETRYDKDKHFSEKASPLASEDGFLKLFKNRVDIAHQNGENVHGMIFDILSLGYESKLDGLSTKRSEVVWYQDTDGSYSQYFGGLQETKR